MKKKEQYTDNEVYFLGNKKSKSKKTFFKYGFLLGICTLLLLLLIAIFWISRDKDETEYYFESENPSTSVVVETDKEGTSHSYIERMEETINDVPLYIYISHNAKLSLALSGDVLLADSSVIGIMQAADIRSDNQNIVGDFVLKGKQLSRGIAKKGFCAIVGDNISIGVNEETNLLQKSIDASGYFFRQYPLVSQGEIVENTLKNKSIRKAIGIRSNKVVIVESRSNESFHDFSQALIDIGVTDAISLVGSAKSHAWYINEHGMKNESGEIPDPELKNVSYIVWQRN